MLVFHNPFKNVSSSSIVVKLTYTMNMVQMMQCYTHQLDFICRAGEIAYMHVCLFFHVWVDDFFFVASLS